MVDANLLVYAFNPADPQHRDAARWFEKVLAEGHTLAIPMLAIGALLRIATHHSLDRLPQRMTDAQRFVDELLAQPNVRLLHTDAAHWSELKRVLQESGVQGRMVTDAQFAALALQHGGTLYTADRHFQHFPRLRWINPLVPEQYG